MLAGLETALPFRCRWKSHPAALTPATQSVAGASGSAGSRSATGSNTVVVVSAVSAPGSSVASGSATGSRIVVVVAAAAPGSSASGSATGATDVSGATDLTVVSEEPHAAVTEHSNTRNPSTLVTAIGRYGRAQSSQGHWSSLVGRISGRLYASVPSFECPVRRGQRNWRSQLQTGRMWPRPNWRVTSRWM